MKENIPFIKKMIEERYTYKEIGSFLGVSKQRIHQIIKNYPPVPWCRHKKTPSKYKALLAKPCNVCGSKENIERHHINGNRRNNNLSNILPLCRTHHVEAEKELFSNGTKNRNYMNREIFSSKVSCQICGRSYVKKRSAVNISRYNLCSLICKNQWRTLK